MSEGHIYVTATGVVDSKRLRLLTEYVARHDIDVMVDSSEGVSRSYSGYDPLEHSASATVIVWGSGPPDPPDPRALGFEESADASGTLITVKLERSRVFPSGLGGPPPIDLRSWTGGDDPELDRLMGYLNALVEHPRANLEWGGTLRDPHVVASTLSAVSELRELTGRFGDLGELLADDSEGTRNLRAALREVGATYRVVKGAIERFVAAGVDSAGVDGRALAKLERGVLLETIRNGRGHCGRIATSYFRVGGVRDGIKPRASAKLLEDADATFGRLSRADGDLFEAMERIGPTLTNEAGVIVTMILTGRTLQARNRIAEGRSKLQPLEDDLDAALASFQQIEESLGYAEDTPTEAEPLQMTIQSIHIAGSVINSNVVAAETIKSSFLAVGAAAISDEMKASLSELHKAVATLTASLADDEAALAARDLEDLTKEATLPNPRPLFWRRAADGLLVAAKRVAEVGNPVVELVTKVTALLA